MLQYYPTLQRGILLIFLLSLVDTAIAQIDLTQQFYASDPNAHQYFGNAVAVSEHIAISGAPGDNNDMGALYVQALENGTWVYKQTLTPNSAESGDLVGASVAAYGDWLITGAPGTGNGTGAAHIFMRSGNLYIYNTTLTAPDADPNSKMGYAVAINDSVAVVSAIGDSGNAGAAYVFQFNENQEWTYSHKIIASDAIASDEFGCSVSITSDAIIAVGARFKDVAPTSTIVHAGAVYIFENNNATTWIQTNKVLPNNPESYQYFGHSVSITLDAGIPTLLVGAYGDDNGGAAINAGAAYLFSGATYTQAAKWQESTPTAANHFGWSVAISGTSAAVGVPFYDDGDGAVYVLPTNSIPTVPQQDTHLDAGDYDNLGHAVAITQGVAFAGAIYNDSRYINNGKAILFELIAQPATTFTASDGTFESSIQLNWTNRSNDPAVTFNVYRDGVLLTASIVQNFYIDPTPNVVLDQNYTYCITAVSPTWGESQQVCDVGFLGRLDAPQGFDASYDTYETWIKLDWSNLSLLADGIYIYKNGGKYDSLQYNQQSYIDTLVISPLEYEYCLSAFRRDTVMQFDTLGAIIDTTGWIIDIIDTLGVATDTTGWDIDTLITVNIIESGLVCDDGRAVLAAIEMTNASYLTYEDHVALSWNNTSIAADSFYIYRDGYFIAALPNTTPFMPNSFTYDDYHAVSTYPHQYCITASRNGYGESLLSTTLPSCLEGEARLFEPKHLIVSQGTFEDQITIMWSDSSFVNEKFKLYKDSIELVQFIDNNGSTVPNPLNTFNYTDTDVEAFVNYTYCVETYHSALIASQQVCATGYITIKEPSNFLASDSTFEDHVALSWTNNSNIQNGFLIYRNGIEIANIVNNAIAGTTITYDDYANISSLKNYNYCIEAYNTTFGASAKVCNMGNAELSQPINLTATDYNDNLNDRITLTFTDNSSFNDGFYVYRNDIKIYTFDVLQGPLGTVYTYDDQEASSYAIHNYCVVAYSNTLGLSATNSCNEGQIHIAPPVNTGTADPAIAVERTLPAPAGVNYFGHDVAISNEDIMVGTNSDNGFYHFGYSQGNYERTQLCSSGGSSVAIYDKSAFSSYPTAGYNDNKSPKYIINANNVGNIYASIGSGSEWDDGSCVDILFKPVLDDLKSYCPSSAETDSYIRNVSCSGDYKNVGFNTGGNGYINYATDGNGFDVTLEGSYTLSVQVYEDDCVFCDTNNKRASIYIDWNHDGDFQDLNEKIETLSYGKDPEYQTRTSTFSVPDDAIVGITTMRIVMRNGTNESYTNQCATNDTGGDEEDEGETEDYVVVIRPNDMPQYGGYAVATYNNIGVSAFKNIQIIRDNGVTTRNFAGAYIWKLNNTNWEKSAPINLGGGTQTEIDVNANQSLAMFTNTILQGAPLANKVYTIDESTHATQTLPTPGNVNVGDKFGWSVDIDQNWAVIGAPSGNDVHIYSHNNNGNFTYNTTITSPNTLIASAKFGWSVAVSGTKMAVGAPDESGGRVYLYNYNSTTSLWEYSTVLKGGNSINGYKFGAAVDLQDNVVIIGAPNEGTTNPPRGETYIHLLLDSQTMAASDGDYNNRVEVNWNFSPLSFVDRFLIYRDTVEIANYDHTVQVHYDYDATPGVIHTYTIEAVQGDIENDPENSYSYTFQDYGFMRPNGKITGTVTSPQAAGVPDIRVCAASTGINYALYFDGNNSLKVGGDSTNLFLDNTDFTLEAWVYVSEYSNNAAEIIVSNRSNNAGAALGLVGPSDAANYKKLFLNLNNVAGGQYIYGTSNIEIGQWYHVAASFEYNDDATIDNNTVKIYVDGILETTQTLAQDANQAIDNMVVGFDPEGNGSHPNLQFNGLIDEVRMWTSLRSTDEIALTLNSTLEGSEEGLTAYFHFNEGGGQLVGDYSAFGAHYASLAIGGPVFKYNQNGESSYCAYTDENGYYEILGIYYNQELELTVTPYKDGHGFNPTQRLRNLSIIDKEANNVDFSDTSAFAIQGTILTQLYNGNNGPVKCPVADVEIWYQFLDSTIDGDTLWVNSNITTDADGKYSLVVFNEGEYAIQPRVPLSNDTDVDTSTNPDNNGTSQPDGSGVDTSLESDDLADDTGNTHIFNPPSIILTALGDTTNIDFTDLTERTIDIQVVGACYADLGTSAIQVTSVGGCLSLSPTVTGTNKVSVQVPPLSYNVFVDYVDNNGQVNVGAINYFETRIQNVDVAEEDTALIFVYNRPFTAKLSNLPSDKTCDGSAYLFTQGQGHYLAIEVYQEFFDTNGNSTICPADSGTLYITDNISGVGLITVDFYNGVGFYQILPGNPNIVAPHTLLFAVQAEVDGAFTPTQNFLGLVQGSSLSSPTFITVSPDIPMHILRAPPGDESGSSLAINANTCNEWTRYYKATEGLNIKYIKTIGEIGSSIIITAPMGIGAATTVFDFGSTLDITDELKFSFEQEWQYGGNYCLETTQNYGTPGNAIYADTGGDLYIGAGFNITYALLNVINYQNCEVISYQDFEWSPADSITTTFAYPHGHVENVLLNQLSYLENISNNLIDIATTNNNADAVQENAENADYFNLQQKSWNNILSFNAGLIDRAIDAGNNQENYSYAGGSTPLSFSKVITESSDSIFNFTMAIDNSLNFDLVADLPYLSLKGGIGIDLGFGFGYSGEAPLDGPAGGTSSSPIGANVSTSTATTTEFNFGDDDVGDFFSTYVYEDNVYKTPVFKLYAGTSSCPYEAGTARRDSCNISTVEGNVQGGVPADEMAHFVVKLTNYNQYEMREFNVRFDNKANPHGAIITMNGVVDVDATFNIPANSYTEAVLSIEKGPFEYNYENLHIIMYPPCEYSIWQDGGNVQNSDTLVVSVFFESPCTDVVLSAATGNTVYDANDLWLVNSNHNNAMQLVLSDYDLDNEFLNGIKLEYRPNFAGGDWTVIDVLDVPTLSSVNNPYYTYNWSVPSTLPDGDYAIKATSLCAIPGGSATNTSSLLNGLIDRETLYLYGTPYPQDGVLNQGEDVVVTFNEPILCNTFVFDEIVSVVDLTTNTTLTYDPEHDFVGGHYGLTCSNDETALYFDIYNISQYDGHILQVTIDSTMVNDFVVAIQDPYGNLLTNPNYQIQWNFQVQEREVFWNPTALNATIYEGDTQQHSLVLDNIGDMSKLFTLNTDNLPNWLSVEQLTSNGIAALGSQSVQVHLNLLNVMVANTNYTDTIVAYIDNNPFIDSDGDGIVNNDNDYEQNLIVTINVLPKPPVWTFNPSDYAYHMNMVAQLNINGTVSTDMLDQVTAVIDGQVRGLANVQFVSALNKYFAFLTIYSNDSTTTSPDLMHFRIWDADEGLLYSAVETFEFEASSLLGSVASPEVLHAGTQYAQCIDLHEGWNWISFNVSPNDNSINSVLQSLNTPSVGDYIKSDTLYAEYVANVGWVGNLTTINPGVGYMLQLSDADMVCLDGGAATSVLPNLTLVQGWNWIGYTAQTSNNLDTALASYGPATNDLIIGENGFAQYNGSTWIGSLTSLNPNEGYKLLADSPGGLTYPELALPAWSVTAAQFRYNMNITGIITIDGVQSVNSNDMVAAYIDGACRGKANVEYQADIDEYLVFLTIFSNDGLLPSNENIEFRIYDADVDTTYSIPAATNFSTDNKLGEANTPHVFEVSTCGNASITTVHVICGNESVGEATVNTNFNCGLLNSPCPSPNTYQIGTSNGISLEDVSPYSGYWSDARYEYLYTAQELREAGLAPGTISSIGFKILAKNSAASFNNFTIKMKCTNASQLNAPAAYTIGTKTVYSGSFTTTTGWNDHPLDANYSWDGESNLIVQVCYNNNGFSSDDIISTQTTDYTSTIAYFDDNTVGCEFNTAQIGFNKKPLIRFGACTVSYAWSDGQTGATASNLNPGTYTVAINFPNGCLLNQATTITGNPAIMLTQSITNASCNTGNDGMASVLVSGGVPPYNYIWNTGSSDNSIDNLTIGTYELYVTDSEGCGINTFIEIADDGISPISFSLNETNSDCGITNNGIASINVWGDSGPYSYNWSNGQNTESINNLAAGTYQATITDINGCTQIAEALIDSNNSDILLDIQSHANCEGTSLQTNTSITNGTPPFTYLWSDGQNTLNAFNLSEGEYNLTVTDANNCMASTNVTVTANAPQAISTIISPADNQNNGYYMCSIAINGATAPYNFNWETTGYVRYEIDAQNGLIQVVYAANADWTVTINDNCYVATTMVNNNDVVYPTNSMALDIVDYTVYPDNGDADGKLIVIVNGGTPQYHYTWQGPQEWLPSINEGYGLNALNNLTTGWYTVTVTDNSSPQQSTMGWYWVSASTNNGSGKDSQMLFSETLQATPNPFAERTTINFTANKTAEAKLIVYDLAGQQIMVAFKSLLQKEQKYNIPLNAASLNKGMYLCTLTYDDGYSETIRLMIAK